MHVETLVPYGRRIRELADLHPERQALIEVDPSGLERPTSWPELDRRSRAIGGLMAGRGVGTTSRVAVALPNSADHLLATVAAWRLGALVVPISPRLPDRERDALLEVAAPTLLVSDRDPASETWQSIGRSDLAAANGEAPVPDVLPQPGKAIASGGSTGRPKLIIDPRPWGHAADDSAGPEGWEVGFRPGQTQLVCGPLYHNSPFVWATRGLLLDQTIVLMSRFDAALVVDLIERHRVGWIYLAPTMMRRILALPGIEGRDLSSLEAVFHTAGPCPPEVKRGWIALVGAERLYEAYGSTEDVGHTRIRGDEWLTHPGSVGRPVDTEILIVGDDGRPVATGEVGEIYMRRPGASETYAYVGAPPARTQGDGFTSVGDLGWLDGKGYLYLADRRTDLIVSGGANVYPAEVEAVLLEHPAVADVAVIGLPDPEWGRRVHAVVEARRGAVVDAALLDAHARERIASYKTPKTYDFVERLPRDESGKIRRIALVEERST